MTGLQQMLAIKAVVKYKGIILSGKSHHCFTQFWVTAGSTALADNPVCRQS
jgi:hypothetical protein